MAAAIAASWDIAWRLVRACPDLRVYETHPRGGQYDCLTLISPAVKIDINRVGSIHVHHSPRGEAIPLIPAERWLERAVGRPPVPRPSPTSSSSSAESQPATTPQHPTA